MQRAPHPELQSRHRQQLFPTEIYLHNYEAEPWCDYYVAQLDLIRTHQGRTNSNGSWTSPDDLDLRPEWQPLKELILSTAHACMTDQGIVFEQIHMNCMWANIHGKSSSHQQHQHPNSHWSGVVYLALDEQDPGELYFRDPRVQAHTWAFEYLPGREHGDHWQLRPQRGQMIIFPSWLEHGTQAHASDQERYCVSFNLELDYQVKFKHSIRKR